MWALWTSHDSISVHVYTYIISQGLATKEGAKLLAVVTTWLSGSGEWTNIRLEPIMLYLLYIPSQTSKILPILILFP